MGQIFGAPIQPRRIHPPVSALQWRVSRCKGYRSYSPASLAILCNCRSAPHSQISYGAKFYTLPPPLPLKIAGVLRSKDGFLHFALRFPIFPGFFCRGFWDSKSTAFLKKPPVLQNRGPPKTKTCPPLSFFNGAQNL